MASGYIYKFLQGFENKTNYYKVPNIYKGKLR